MELQTCFGCGQEFYELHTPMRCYDCVKNGVQVQTSPVRDAYWAAVNPEGKNVNDEGFILPEGMTKEQYQDRLIRDLMISSAVPTQILEDGSM